MARDIETAFIITIKNFSVIFLFNIIVLVHMQMGYQQMGRQYMT